MSGAAVLAGYSADLLVGDPPRWHPVAGFGRAATALEGAGYAPSRARGAAFAAALVGATALAAELLARATPRGRGVALAAVTWAALGGRSLRREAERLAACLERGELEAARAGLRALCGRDARELGERELCRAIVESVAENTSDAVVGALLWGALGGPAGVAAYRAANTLDAMVGHRDERYAEFGYAAAKLDDAMSWPAARVSVALTALSAPVVGGSPRAARNTARRDGAGHPSPNAGRVEAAFAGALGITLGGPLAYQGAVEHRPELGDGRPPEIADIYRATRLSLAVGAAAASLAAAAAALASAAAVARRPLFTYRQLLGESEQKPDGVRGGAATPGAATPGAATPGGATPGGATPGGATPGAPAPPTPSPHAPRTP